MQPRSARPAPRQLQTNCEACDGSSDRGAAMGAVSKLPPGVPPVVAWSRRLSRLRYQDIKIGTGAEAEPNKIYKVLYTGWLAADGHKFDSSEDHPHAGDGQGWQAGAGRGRQAKAGRSAADQLSAGVWRVIPGFDQGFEGMKVGGKRRLFIPWQLPTARGAGRDRTRRTRGFRPRPI